MNSKLNMSGWKVSRLTPCRVDTPEGSISVSWTSNSDGGERDRKAEEAARLIASAPELLEALINARKELEDICADNGLDLYNNLTLNAAIAKATGESA